MKVAKDSLKSFFVHDAFARLVDLEVFLMRVKRYDRDQRTDIESDSDETMRQAQLMGALSFRALSSSLVGDGELHDVEEAKLHSVRDY